MPELDFWFWFRLNRNWKQNAGIMAALYGFGVVWGVIIELLGIVF